MIVVVTYEEREIEEGTRKEREEGRGVKERKGGKRNKKEEETRAVVDTRANPNQIDCI